MIGIFDENFVERDVFLAFNLSILGLFWFFRHDIISGWIILGKNILNVFARVYRKFGKNGR